MTADDGVIRFRLEHRTGPLPDELAGLVTALDGWRWKLWTAGLVGQDGVRYGGVGWGNLSARLPGPGPGSVDPGLSFLVTGTQTGGLERTDARHYALVEACELTGPDGVVRSRGPVAPSSEAMSHAAVYRSAQWVGCVFHGHDPSLWQAAARLGLPRTPDEVEYGTVAMAEAVAALVRSSRPSPGESEGRVLVMGGHRDGVLAWGASLEEAGEALLGAWGRAVGRSSLRSMSL